MAEYDLSEFIGGDDVYKIKDSVARSAIENMNKIFTNVNVPISSWISDASYADYPYKAVITCQGITSNYFAEVIFDVTEATSGIFAPITNSDTNSVIIYASEIPSNNFNIPIIKCTKVD